MNSHQGHLSPSGVLTSENFRTNLIIDRYDPVFADMRASKLNHLRSAISKDAVTWNVFRSLRQIAPETWSPTLWQSAFPLLTCPVDLRVVVKLWESVAPPLGLLAGGAIEVFTRYWPKSLDRAGLRPTWSLRERSRRISPAA